MEDRQEFITAADQVTPTWLNRVLERTGLLGPGTVTAVERRLIRMTQVSVVVPMKVTYSSDVPAAAPTNLFLKFSKPGLRQELGTNRYENEVDFYNRVSLGIRDSPGIRCHGARYSAETGSSYVLLDDLSETHLQPPWPLPPSRADCERVIDCLAKLHAGWWEDSRLGKEIGRLEQGHLFLPVELRERVVPFIHFLGDRLSPRRGRIYERLLTTTAARWSKPVEPVGLTVVHGDAHAWNFLYPRDPAVDHVRIFDWHRWRVDVGPLDLAHLMACAWFPERRALMEKDLVRRYQGALAALGVRDYSWDQCWEDYRKCVIRSLVLPVRSWALRRNVSLWWAMLERLMLAYDDLGCEELLDG